MHIRDALLPLLALGLSGVAAAQIQGSAIVATRVLGPQTTVLLEVDLATGILNGLPSFPSDTLAPRALAIDPIDHTLLLALDAGAQSRIVRLQRGAGAMTEQVLGTVAGPATEILVDSLGDVVVAVDGRSGGVQRLPRHGGAAGVVRNQPFVTAMGTYQQLAWGAILGLSGTATAPAVDPGQAELDFTSGQFQMPPSFFPGFTPLGITGLVDLPTAVPRQVFAHDDGSFSLFSAYIAGNPQPLATTPALPAGGAVAMKTGPNGPTLVLGGQSHPFLWTYDPLTALGGSLALAVVAGPLPGDPVDYALWPAGGAELFSFAPACGSAAELRIHGANGLPQPGNGAFAIGLTQGLPSQPSLLAVGFAELQGVVLPNGCLVRVLPAAIAFRVTDALGNASQPLPVPQAPGLLGLLLFAQWFQDDLGLPFLASPVLAIRVGT